MTPLSHALLRSLCITSSQFKLWIKVTENHTVHMLKKTHVRVLLNSGQPLSGKQAGGDFVLKKKP